MLDIELELGIVWTNVKSLNAISRNTPVGPISIYLVPSTVQYLLTQSHTLKVVGSVQTR